MTNLANTKKLASKVIKVINCFLKKKIKTDNTKKKRPFKK